MEKKPRYSKHTYELVADILKLAHDAVGDYSGNADPLRMMYAGMILRFCREFERDNPRFDGDKFRRACGISDD